MPPLEKFTFALALLFLTCADAGDVRYLALGDSFTIGTGSSEKEAFPARVALLAVKRGVVVQLQNVAVNGYSTQELIDQELPAVKPFRPTHVTIAIGANDLVRGRGPDDYRRNLKRIFAALKADGVAPTRVWALPQPDWGMIAPDGLHPSAAAHLAWADRLDRALGLK